MSGLVPNMKRWVPLALALLITTGLAACGDDGSPAADSVTTTEAASGATTTTAPADGAAGAEVEVTAVDFGFDLPETLPAGPTTFTLTNAGEQPHQMILIPMQEGAPPVEDLIKLKQKEAAKYFAGPPQETHAKPGETGKPLEVDLKPGTYVYACFFSDKKTHKPHAFLGMRGTLEVQ